MYSISILFLIVFFSFGFSQEIIIVDQNNKQLFGIEELKVQVKIDNKSTLEFNLLKEKILIDKSQCDSLADIRIFGYLTQDYYNQYTPNQFKLVDTIKIVHSQQIIIPTPIFLIDVNQSIDTIIINNLYFKNYIEQIGLPYSIYFEVFNSSKISKKEKKFIEKVKKIYCEKIGLENEKIKLVFSKNPYISNQLDFFNKGSQITDDFIESQNTSLMKKQAERYKLVTQLIINWEK